MDVDEIIIYRVQRDRMRMVLDFLQQKQVHAILIKK